MIKFIAQDDIILRFSRDGGSTGITPGYQLRVASRHGQRSMLDIVAGIEPYLANGVKLSASVETPSRFTPQDD